MRCWFHVRLDISGVGAVAGEESFPTLFEDEGKLVSLQAQRDSSVVDRGVACQRDGTTVLPRAWDHLEVLSSMAVLLSGVNGDAPSLAVGGAFDDEGVRS